MSETKEEKEKDFSHVEGPLNQLAKILANKEGDTFSRRIEVSDEASGIRVTRDLVVIQLKVALDGSPLDTIKEVFRICEDFDTRGDRAREKAIAEAKEEADKWIGYLHRTLDSDEYREFIEDTIWR